MTREEVKDLLKFIIRKCDLIINNENYTADEYAQDKIEDIAEICHRVLDGQFGEIIEPSLPSNLDEAAERAYPIDISGYSVECRVGAIPEPLDYHERERKAFKAGAEWMAGQGLNARKEE